DREAQVRGRERVGLEALSGRDSAGGVAAPDGGLMRLSEKCARFLTVPKKSSNIFVFFKYYPMTHIKKIHVTNHLCIIPIRKAA
ncbi:hypothetical protein, partial [Enteroscipio rubneri]|uniref:hypothetical protein n=1 Tax=Enteroscipio rubneri TaxID=2070686 RepID=UPI003AF1B0A0